MRRYVAIDLGAESGRVIVGSWDGGKLALEEAHRFANVPVRTPAGLHWDVLRLYADMLDGLRAAGRLGEIATVGVDTWGVDYALLDGAGRLLGNPYHYRDARVDRARERTAAIVPGSEQFSRTGSGQLPFSTLYQLFARTDETAYACAERLLMLPDLFHYWLCGTTANERTNASTTGALGVDGTWDRELIERVGIRSELFGEIVEPGSVLGALGRDVRDARGLGAARVVAPATHDTASAIAAIPASATPFAFLSSGTWSLLGLELTRPVVNEHAYRAGFANETGPGGTVKFLRNIVGLWIVQQCRVAWNRAGANYTYDELTLGAAALPRGDASIDVDDPALIHPDDMPAALNRQLQQTGQSRCDEPFALVRAVYAGLAERYRSALAEAERITGVRATELHVVGGGARNAFLCRLTADACKRPVLAGPTEATALGNILVALIATGEIADLAQARAVARRSVTFERYEPSFAR